MKYQDKKVAGVWIDSHEAMVITTPDMQYEGNYEIVEKLKTEHHTNKGKSENSMNNKKSQELQHFFKNVTDHVKKYDVLYIIGPGQAQEQFKNYFKTHAGLHNTELEIGTADTHQTQNQMIAQVRDHFKKA